MQNLIKKIKNDNVSKNYFLNTIGVSLNSFSILIYLVIINRVNGIDETGMFSFVFSFSGIIQSIALFGGRVYQVSDTNGEFRINDYYTSKIFSMAFSILVTIIYVIFNNFTFEKILLLVLILAIKFIETFSDVIFGIFQVNDKLSIVGKSYLIKNGLGIIIFAIVDYITKQLAIATLSLVILNIIVYIYYDRKNVKKYHKMKIRFKKSTLLVLKSSMYYFIYSFLVLVIANVSRFTVDKFLTDEGQGYFGILIMIPSVVTLFGQFIVQPVIVEFSGLNENKEFYKLNRKIFLCVLQSIGVCLICMFAAFILGETVLSLLYNLSFEGYKYIFLFMILSGLFNVITLIYSTVLTIQRRTKVQVILYLFVFIIAFIISIVLTEQYELNGAIMSYVIVAFCQCCIFALYYYIIKRLRGEKNENIVSN